MEQENSLVANAIFYSYKCYLVQILVSVEKISSFKKSR